MALMPMIVWYSFFLAFLAGFILILYRERKRRFAFYAAFGALLGYFVFDVPSVNMGFYAYPAEHYLLSILNVPVSMALAEGFCVAITIYIYEKLPWLLGLFRMKKK